MASIEIRFRNGDEAQWELHDGMNLEDLVKTLSRSTGTGQTVCFGVKSGDEGVAAYDFVGLAMADVISWRMIGMFDATSGAALWAELQNLPPDPD